MLIKMLNNSIKDPQTHSALLALNSDGSAVVGVYESIEYKSIELFHCLLRSPSTAAKKHFVSSKFADAAQQDPDELLKKHVTYRFQVAKVQMLMMEERLRDVIKIIKAKNPTLLQLIQKGAMKSVQGGMIKAGVTAEQVVQTGGATLKNA
eukprot:CAMPEP_0202961920 /NCGR_PEP_ID=MMETSP1396-20130829/6026_1 /ASSEMBLY_ACC=CAM_ASM_000872 /TAXON_ID= /ORGANISM="Pseudokeronopsis sp., Strain Brazil" /LENGTH=149 /DNA_ID=CAMNT_0049682145 /DNA_START=153 /DNA_END=599 /DNA_ORIENTATION=-